MACEKYSNWMIDAALDALSPQRQAEFFAHLSECRRCREELDRARAVSGAVDRGVAALVVSEPSPHFEAKLRARLAAEPAAQHVWRFGWAPAGAVAAALIAAVALIAIKTGQMRHESAARSVGNSIASVDASKAQPAGINPNFQPSARSDSGEIVSEPRPPYGTDSASRPARQNVEHADSSKLASAHEPQPEVLVQPGQFAMIERYAEAAREGRVDGTQIVKLGDDDAAPLDIQAIEIAPLRIQGLPHPDDSSSSESSDSADAGKS